MGPLDGLDPFLVAVFAVAAFVAVAGAVLVTGFLPRANGPEGGRGPVGAFLVYGTAAVLAVLALATLRTATELPWAVAVVIVGLAILGAPFAVQPLPEAARESRAGLVGVAALALLALVLLPTVAIV